MISNKLIKESKEFVEKKLVDFYEGFTLEHTNNLLKICLAVAKNFEVKKDIIKISVLFHDVGRTVSDDSNHPIESWKIAKQFLQNRIPKEDLEIIKDCITNHSHNGKPVSTEAKIIKDCDKISMTDPKIILLFLYNLTKVFKDKENVFSFLIKNIKKCQGGFELNESKDYYEDNYKNFSDRILKVFSKLN